MPILKVEVQGPEILPLWDIVDIEAARFEWRSWLWQEKNLPADHHLTPGVRAFMVGEAGSIQLIAAQHAFFSLDKAYINKLMAHLGYDMPAGRSLYETLCAAVAKVLGCNEERTHNIVHKRVVELKNAAAYTNELLHCDEAVQVMDRSYHMLARGRGVGASFRWGSGVGASLVAGRAGHELPHIKHRDGVRGRHGRESRPCHFGHNFDVWWCLG